MSETRDRVARQPFEPVKTAGQDAKLDAMLRIAHALEYIAGQLHELQLTEHYIALTKSQSVYIPPD
jgi:hypothetical protein